MKRLSLFLFLVIPGLSFSQQLKEADALVTPRVAPQVITVGGFEADIQGFNSRSIQYAIDAIKKSGGTVILNPGTYIIEAPVRLCSNITLKGAGRETILKKTSGVQTRFVVDADYGELKLTVENADGFVAGMKIQVSDDDNSSCWNVSTAYVTDVRDDVIYIDKGLIRDYRSDKNGRISNTSSVIDVIDAENVIITGLTADGNRENNFFADGCNNAGILVMRSKKVTIDNVHVKDFNGEGISWQITENVTVKNSEISGSGNTGMHPGTGSPFTRIENNDVHHNDRDGLFICWRVYDSQVLNNRFHHNGRFGICTGHKDADVLFLGNHVFNNKSDGIHLRGERESNAPHRNTFEKNIIEDNGTGGGGYGFSVNSPARELLLKENIFKNTSGTQKAAIFIHKEGAMPELRDNRFDKHDRGELVKE